MADSDTLASYQALRDELLAAIDESTGGNAHEYEINGRRVTREEATKKLAFYEEKIAYYKRLVNRASGGSIRNRATMRRKP